MPGTRDEIKERIRAVLKNLTEEERRLLSHVLRVENLHLNQKSPNVTTELLKLVRQVIT